MTPTRRDKSHSSDPLKKRTTALAEVVKAEKKATKRCRDSVEHVGSKKRTTALAEVVKAEKKAAKRCRDSVEHEGSKKRKHQRKGPSAMELELLQDMLSDTKVPILTADEADAMLGRDPELLGEGTYGEAFLNATKKVVIKFSFDFYTYKSSVTEAKFMLALEGVYGVQRLVGVCPERFMLVTKYGGPTLSRWTRRKSPLLPLQWVQIAIDLAKVFGDIHSDGVVHNDIKSNNICLDVTPKGTKITVIDFGLAKKYGHRQGLQGDYDPDHCYPPEFFDKYGGRCCSRTDVYGIGKVLRKIQRHAKLDSPDLTYWREKSQRRLPESRRSLASLLRILRAERRRLERRMR
ncbi:uncharacterized protein LOC122259826 [Penaeus japonicus]|uniref:uncharacterized protein LOC122259826 n=1 Tax=Penaeus japonicus TaxID=27405 RepID=UPI001C7175B7|nr:uncharacterized protein LOC122259826 [Penaeus japonicus]